VQAEMRRLDNDHSAATSPELQAGFEKYLQQTQAHVSRLERIFNALGESPCKDGGPQPQDSASVCKNSLSEVINGRWREDDQRTVSLGRFVSNFELTNKVYFCEVSAHTAISKLSEPVAT